MTEKRSRMDFGQYYLLIYSAKCCRSHWTVLHGADRPQTKAQSESSQTILRQNSRMLCNGQVTPLTWLQFCIHFIGWRDNDEKTTPWANQDVKTSAVEAWKSSSTDEAQHLVMSAVSRPHAVISNQIKWDKVHLWIWFTGRRVLPLKWLRPISLTH